MRSVKYEKVCLRIYKDGREAMISIDCYFRFYNTELLIRPLATGHRLVFNFAFTQVPIIKGGMIEPPVSDPLRMEGLSLNIAMGSTSEIDWCKTNQITND